MLFMITSRTRKDLTPAAYAQLATLARDFYANVPPRISLLGNWGATDGSVSFAVLDAPATADVEALQEPFRPFVDITITPVQKLQGWQAE